MSKSYYIYSPIPELDLALTSEPNLVITSVDDDPENLLPLELALYTINLARKLGVRQSVEFSTELLPYCEKHDNLVFPAPIAGLVTGRSIHYLRGWKQYGSCVKCFNGLGLLGEHILKEMLRLNRCTAAELRTHAVEYLLSRKAPDHATGDGVQVFSSKELAALSDNAFAALDVEALAIWRTYGCRPIVCSTSSNMGISLHEALRLIQSSRQRFQDREFTVLNRDEGCLIIWCPDEQADFMNPEKTEHLRTLETEQPPLTILHTYINRKQRDPGALKDALNLGGYFFPTNPQSKDEMQNLLTNSLTDMAKERNCTMNVLLADEKVNKTLRSMGCSVRDNRVLVQSCVEGGLFGLMAGYLVMLEETVSRKGIRAISTWNQASIGAALAAAVLADLQFRDVQSLPASIRQEIAVTLPALDQFLRHKQLGKDIKTRIHGVFDLANIQSLAQLLGVVVERHLSGRGTAFVGLGSSSYANGNRCFEILKSSMAQIGPFVGKETFHPSTHTLNPIAQALVYADDFHRAVSDPAFSSMAEEARIQFLMRHCRKPEPAGAAAMAGYLLSRFDDRTLSLVELAVALRLSGFDSATFLNFSGFNKDVKGTNWFLQEATEEGPYMEQLAKNFLKLLDWEIADLLATARKERLHSRLNYRLRPLDPDIFEVTNPLVMIYLTGDNTRQPHARLVSAILERHLRSRKELLAVLQEDKVEQGKETGKDNIGRLKIMFARLSNGLEWCQTAVDNLGNRILAMHIKSKVDEY